MRLVSFGNNRPILEIAHVKMHRKKSQRVSPFGKMGKPIRTRLNPIAHGRPLWLEHLEARNLMAYDPLQLQSDMDVMVGEAVYRSSEFAPILTSDPAYENDSVPTPAGAGLLDAPPFPLSDTFALHSRPGATKVIYLDFNGHTTSNTFWNEAFTNGNSFTSPAYSIDGSSSFSDVERERIQRIWQRVVEDFLPFDVDITTEDPGVEALRRTGPTDTQWGVRVVIGGSSSDWYTGGAGGVAYLDSFNWSTDTPCFAFNENLNNGEEKATAECISHEIGHTLGLRHDGTSTLGYYAGHGNGATGWAPIMGVGYYEELVQWSKGEYPGANMREDDLQIITTQNGFGYRVDDHGNTRTSATEFEVIAGVINDEGIIERNTDLDYFSFTTIGGQFDLDITPFYLSPNLDILATLYDAGGTVVATSNPTNALNAEFNMTLGAGTYYVSIDGTGKPASGQDFGYSDYGSLGYFSITGTIPFLTEPEINVRGNGVSIVDGDTTPASADHTNFGSTSIDDATTLRKFTIQNIGGADVNLTGDPIVQIMGANAGDFTVTLVPPQSTLTPGQSVTFEVTFDPSAVGLRTATISIANSDEDENPYEFAIQGRGVINVFNNPENIAIPESGLADPFPSTLEVSGLFGTITDVNVSIFGFTHSFTNDVDILLVGPGGQKVLLLSDIGGGYDVEDLTLHFDDSAGTGLPFATQLTSGTYRPTNVEFDEFPAPTPVGPYGSSLGGFNGTDANGTWKLFVYDDNGQDFGEITSGWRLTIFTTDDEIDYGDAPSQYPTTIANNGAAHNATGPKLGNLRDAETNGKPSLTGEGDDSFGSADDEDGVVFKSGLVAGENAEVEVTVSETGRLSAWIDFNGDGDWTDLGEQIFTDLIVESGVNLLTFPVSFTPIDVTYARFRISSLGGLSYNGLAPDGEVEDYALGAVSGTKWHDSDEDGQWDEVEHGVAGWTIFADLDEDGVRDDAEPFGITDEAGLYTIAGLGTGTYVLAEVVQTGWIQTDAPAVVTIAAGEHVAGANFGNYALPNTIAGQEWHDRNGDRIKDPDEPGLSGWTVFLDHNGNGTLEEGVQTLSAEDVPKTILDGSTVISQINVPDLSMITDVNLTLNVSHTYVGDLIAYLISPAGTRTKLFTSVGDNGNGFQNTVFDDEALMSISNGAAPFVGSFRPEELLSAYDGEDPRGTWTLRITDITGQDAGALESWSLTITSSEPHTITDSLGNYKFENLTPGEYNVAQLIKTDWLQTYPSEIGTSYSASSVAYEFEDIAATGNIAFNEDLDDESYALTAGMLSGFEFSFFGVEYDSLFFNSNGLITFGSGTTAYTNEDLTDSPDQAAIAVFWDDLIVSLIDSLNSSVLWEVRGAGDDQRLIIQWEEMGFYAQEGSGTVTLQAILSEGDGSIQFNYLDLEAVAFGNEGESATVGIKDEGFQADPLVLSYNDGPNEFVATGKSVVIAPVSGAPGAHRITLQVGDQLSGLDFGNQYTGTVQAVGDFDLNGAVTGRDFLFWQRNQGIGDLSAWQLGYGVTLASPPAIIAQAKVSTLVAPKEDAGESSDLVLSLNSDQEELDIETPFVEEEYAEEVDAAFAELASVPLQRSEGFGELVVRRCVAKRFDAGSI